MGWDMAGSAWGQRHELYDLSGAVTLANGFIEASGRHVDWLHIPALDRSDDAFFTPLEGLKSQGVRIYLGLIHHMVRFHAREATARKYCPDFGVATYCGFGREDPATMPNVLKDHLEAVELSAKSS